MRDLILYPGISHRALGWQTVSPEDVRAGAGRVVSLEEANRHTLVPYCLDIPDRHVIFATGIRAQDALGATFHYQYLREHSTGFLQVPIEWTPATLPALNLDTTVLFSAGRCGSTLLARLVEGMGVTTISEPDFYSQTAEQVLNIRGGNMERGPSLHLQRYAHFSLLAPLTHLGARQCMIKLRAHANAAPDLLMEGMLPGTRVLFMMRGFESWCESRVRAFAGSLEENLEYYMYALNALHWLRQNTDCTLIHYEDLQAQPQAVIQQLADLFGVVPDTARMNAILAEDAQADTGLARNQLAAITPQQQADIRDYWRQNAPRALLAELNFGRAEYGV